MKLFSFEKLNLWQKTKNLSILIHKVTKSFPDDEKFGLTNQMRRCSIPILSNIAEGKGRHSSKDKARSTEITFGSALELLNQSILCNDLGFLSVQDYTTIGEEISRITAMLDGLHKSQINA